MQQHKLKNLDDRIQNILIELKQKGFPLDNDISGVGDYEDESVEKLLKEMKEKIEEITILQGTNAKLMFRDDLEKTREMLDENGHL